MNDRMRHLPWDSEFFGFTIGRVDGELLTKTEAEAAVEWARDEGVDCLYFLASPDDAETHRAAQNVGFRLVDTRATYGMPLSGVRPPPTDLTIRKATADDLPILEPVARTAYPLSRFFFDPHFPDELAAELYGTWLGKSIVEGYADRVFVAAEEEEPLGFVTCDIHERENRKVGEIGLIGVRESARGRGVGKALVAAATGWYIAGGATTAEVVTQARNLAAQRLWTRQGYKLERVQLWFHWWQADG